MCDGVERLKLCTCTAEIGEGRPHWELSRLSLVQPSAEEDGTVEHVLSTVVFKDPSLSSQMFLEIINSRDCFDFNYHPLPGDLLTVVLPEDSFCLVCSGESQRWIRDKVSFQNPPKGDVHVRGGFRRYS